MHVFLTGGTGFIGSFIVIELIRQGHRVTVLARNPDKVPALKSQADIDIVKGDITDLDLLGRLVEGKDACIHAALNYTKNTGGEVLRDDTLPTVFLSDVAAAAGVKQFIYTSSTAVNDSLYSGASHEQEDPIAFVTCRTKQRPATLYGATKAASENYLIAQSYRFPMRVNIIRPGYTFGNPVVEGAPTQADDRFRVIVTAALANRPLRVVKNDGTQFIWAGDLAALFVKVLESRVNRKIYFGLGATFVSWEAIAREAIKRCASRSELIVEDKGWSEAGLAWDVADMKNDFGLEFGSWKKIKEHLDFLIGRAGASF